MTSAQLHSHQPDLASFKHRRVLRISLASSYIANGRIVGSDQLEVWVLDNSEIAEKLRAQPLVDFEVLLNDGMALRGRAFVTLGVCRTGQNKKRYVEAILTVEDAVQSVQESAPLHWLT